MKRALDSAQEARDQELMQRAGRGDAVPLDELVSKYNKRIVGFFKQWELVSQTCCYSEKDAWDKLEFLLRKENEDKVVSTKEF